MKKIPLTQGRFALVDDKDYERLSQWKWQYGGGGYAMRTIQRDKKCSGVYMHREIVNPPQGAQTDHRDGNGLNNCRDNLRIATPAQNQWNQKKHKGTSSRYKGVYWDRQYGKWRAQIGTNHNRVRLGRFGAEEDAARAYDRMARRLFGGFARLNFEGGRCKVG